MDARATRRALGAAAIPAAALPRPALSQGRGVRLIVPFAPGGAIDTIARLTAQRVSARLGETWVVENRSGGSGRVGTEAVWRAAPDGRTLLFSSEGHLVRRLVIRDIPFDPVAEFTPVGPAARGPIVFVGSPSLPARDLASVVAAMKARPGDFAFANSSAAAQGLFATERFKRAIGTPDVLVVTYRGTAPALNDVMGGQVALMMAPMLSVLPFVRDDRLRAFGVAAAERSRIAPEIPTIAEGGVPGVEFAVWYGMWGPPALPAEVLRPLNDATRAMAADPEVARLLEAQGCEPMSMDGETFARFIAAEYRRVAAVIAEVGIQPE